MDTRRHSSVCRGEAGYTLVELLTVTVLLGVVLSTAYMVFGSVNSVAGQTNTSTASSDEARRAMVTVTSEIRQAVEATSGLGVFAAASGSSCTFYCDADHDNVPERVGYSVANGILTRTSQSSATSSAPFVFSGAVRSQVCISDLANGSGAPVFRYFDASGDETSVCADISLVRVSIVARSVIDGVTGLADMTSDVKVRSVNSDVLD
jgi:prepilin-type N-terminal cleavage/methylation domain-containing protein